MQAHSSHTVSQLVVFKGATLDIWIIGGCGVVVSTSALESEDLGSIPSVSNTFSKCPKCPPTVWSPLGGSTFINQVSGVHDSCACDSLGVKCFCVGVVTVNKVGWWPNIRKLHKAQGQC